MILKNKRLKIPKKIFKFFEKLRNISGYIFFFQIGFILLILLWYSTSSAIVRHNPDKILNFLNEKAKNIVGFEIRKLDDYIYISLKGILYNFLPSKLEKIDLSLSQESIIQIEFQRQNRGKKGLDEKTLKLLSDFVNGSIIYKEKKIPIKLRVKGDRKIHFKNFATTSFKIDVRKDNRIWGLEEFSIQKPIVRNYVYEYIYHQLNKKIGNISLKYKAVDLSFNGIKRGVFVIEEGFSSELLERHGKRNGPIYTGVDETSGKYPTIFYEAYSEMSWVSENLNLLRTGYSILNNMKDNNIVYENYIDWDSWAKFFAVTDLMQTYHGALPRNLKIYYNPVIGKIEPISFDGHYGTADFSNFIILDYLKNDSSCLWICDQREWFFRFLLNEEKLPRKEFIELYIKYLKQITSDDFLNEFIDQNKNEIENLNNSFYKEFSKSDQIFWKGWVPYVYDKNYLNNRSKQIIDKLNKLDFSHIILKKKNNQLVIDPTINKVPFKLSSSPECNIKKDQWIVNKTVINWDDDCNELIIYSIDNRHKNFYLFNNPKINYDILPINFQNYEQIHKYLDGNLVNNKYFLDGKKTYINKNLIVPKNISLNITEGQELIISNNSSLIILGELNILGKENNPTIIRGSEINPGNIISIGNKITIENLHLKNLKYPIIPGYELYAGFNIIDAEVSFKKVKISDFIGEDMLNLIGSNSKLNDVSFKNSKSDALDVDSGNIKFNNIFCENIGNDCIDISNTVLEGEYLSSENVYDKTLSLGEKSFANIKNLNIVNSEIGIAVKDASVAKIENIVIDKSTLPIAVFVKKTEYGPASLEAKNLNIINSNDILLVDNLSSLIIENKKIIGKYSGKEIESQLYGNKYGIATER